MIINEPERADGMGTDKFSVPQIHFTDSIEHEKDAGGEDEFLHVAARMNPAQKKPFHQDSQEGNEDRANDQRYPEVADHLEHL